MLTINLNNMTLIIKSELKCILYCKEIIQNQTKALINAEVVSLENFYSVPP